MDISIEDIFPGNFREILKIYRTDAIKQKKMKIFLACHIFLFYIDSLCSIKPFSLSCFSIQVSIDTSRQFILKRNFLTDMVSSAELYVMIWPFQKQLVHGKINFIQLFVTKFDFEILNFVLF